MPPSPSLVILFLYIPCLRSKNFRMQNSAARTDNIAFIWSFLKHTISRKSILFPVRKQDKPTTNPNSYRPISLACTMCKLMKKMITKDSSGT